MRSTRPVRRARRTWSFVAEPSVVRRPWLASGSTRVLADDEDRAGVGAGVDEEAVEGRVAEALELELAGEDVAEVAHRRLDPVAPGEGADEAVEGARRSRRPRRAESTGSAQASGSQPVQSWV